MKILDFDKDNKDHINEAATLLIECFKENCPKAWPDMQSALEEVHECLKEANINRIAVDDNNTLIGWIGGNSQYSGNVWELHPLVVKPDFQRKGIGRALAEDFENEVKKRGGLTVWLGSDDENSMTSLSNADLYDNLWEKIDAIKNYKNHPYEFYQKLGYKIVGVMPDANGIGKPDIYMAKRVV